jgi:histidinol-phosphate aminotransferase
VRDFSRWPRLEGCLRVTIGTPEENDAFLAALRSSLQQVGVTVT